ncbi:putative 3-demethylubiquinone-9 3-methyltransferase (glyoxalase superfamily) [Sinomonas atrocyanea]|jgi:predicted 3-demethylubiquinone-9 3-methyltransferase (glyoxalase superfamily)|uniref:VOC family protein n=1 Tax=Sinomonas atrocyanea TaxID=37927 RepID=UPI0027801595|nr:VOC family protein [Sinomonas atrocyanea]MDP9884018.1 putative 3-demethylubiquinone-9 3-methyltransferase (glyoxalase superfamily) [Sinomonas atrocyanea]
MPEMTTCLWFDTQAEDAARYYTGIFPNSRITGIERYGEAGPREQGSVMTAAFELDGRPFLALNGGPEFTFTEAVSIQIFCRDQDEVDHYWNALTADGGEESQCGWLKDRFGFSWQVIPTRLEELRTDPDRARAQRAFAAMLSMRKIVIADLEAAADAG